MATTDSTTITRRFAAACGLMPIQYAATVLPAFVQTGGTGAVQEGSGAAAHNALQQQLTIFYGGMVMVLDGCAPEKAAELIRLAAAADQGQGAPKPTPAPAPGDIQIARNASLRRFLSKRKDRATVPAPAPAPAPVLDPEPVPFQRKDDDDDDEPQPPAEKKGKLEVSCEEAASTWLALGSPGSTHAL